MSETEYFLSQDGIRLYYRHWPVENPTKIVCIVHGLAEHSERYEHVAQYMNQCGFAVFAVDLRGHGISHGKRGHTPSYELLLGDIEELLKTARAEYTDTPMVLLGHSMGGNIVANYVLKMNTNELKGFILSSPWLRLVTEPPQWKIKMARTVAKVLPSLTQSNELVPEHLSHEESVIKAYQDDHLVHGVISVKLFLECYAAGEEALQRAFEVKIPGLVFHGTEDQITNPSASETYASHNDKVSYVPVKGNYHENFNETNKEDVLKMVCEWIDSAV